MAGRRWRVSVVLVTTLMGGGLFLSAPVFAAAEAVTLRFKGQPGEETRYRTEATFSMDMTVKDPSSGNTVFTLAPRFQGQFVTVQRVEAVSPEGNLTLAGRTESFQTNLTVGDLSAALALAGPNGTAARFPRLPELPIRTVMSPRGAVVSITGLESLPIPPLPAGPSGQKINLREVLPKLISMFSVPAFPENPVSPGESWQTQLTISPLAIMEAMGVPVPPEAAARLKTMAFPIVITSAFTGFETVDGVQTAVIKTNAPWQLNIPAGPAGSQQTVHESGQTAVVTNFDVAAGRRVRQQANTNFQMVAGPAEKPFVQATMQGQATTALVP